MATKEELEKAKKKLSKTENIQKKTSEGLRKVKGKMKEVGETLKTKFRPEATAKAAPKVEPSASQTATRATAERAALKDAELRARASGKEFRHDGSARGKLGRALKSTPGVGKVLGAAERVAANPLARGLGRVVAPFALASEAIDVGSGFAEGMERTGRVGGKGGGLDVARKRSFGESIVNPVSAAGSVLTGGARDFGEGMQQAEADLTSTEFAANLAGGPQTGLRERLRKEYDAQLAAEGQPVQEETQPAAEPAQVPGTSIQAAPQQTGLRAAAANRDFLTPESRAFQTGGGNLRQAGFRADPNNPMGTILAQTGAMKLANEENRLNQAAFENRRGLFQDETKRMEAEAASAKDTATGLKSARENISKVHELRREGNDAEASSLLDASFSVAEKEGFDPSSPATVETFANILSNIDDEKLGTFGKIAGIFGEGISASDLFAPESPLLTPDTISRFGVIDGTLQYVGEDGNPVAVTDLEDLDTNVAQKLMTMLGTQGRDMRGLRK